MNNIIINSIMKISRIRKGFESLRRKINSDTRKVNIESLRDSYSIPKEIVHMTFNRCIVLFTIIIVEIISLQRRFSHLIRMSRLYETTGVSLMSVFIITLSQVMTLYSQQADECINCHLYTLETKEARLFATDVHFKFGVSCADCHGGDKTKDDMDEAMNSLKGYIGIPSRNKVVDMCLDCHSNEKKLAGFGSKKSTKPLMNFKSSVHGKNEILNCITCHGIHNIKSVKDLQSPVYPTKEVKLCSRCHSDANYMKTFNPSLPTDQYEKYLTSVHGIENAKGDIYTATCSDCHSAHNIFQAKDPRSSTHAYNVPRTCAHCHSDKDYMRSYDIPTDQFDKYSKSAHGIALLKKHDDASPACNDCHGNHGAIPVGIKSISHICGTCHALNAEMFSASPHAKVFEENNIPQCEVCHSNHLIEKPNDDMLGNGKKSVCIQCHRNSTDKGFTVMNKIKSRIDSLIALRQQAKHVLDKAENKGMDVSDAKYEIPAIEQILMKTRTIIHKADLGEFQSTIGEGFDIVLRAIKDGKNALDDFYFRRWGLGAATLIITILAIALYLKIKSIEM